MSQTFLCLVRQEGQGGLVPGSSLAVVEVIDAAQNVAGRRVVPRSKADEGFGYWPPRLRQRTCRCHPNRMRGHRAAHVAAAGDRLWFRRRNMQVKSWR